MTNISIKVTAKHFYKTNGSPKPGFKTFLSDSSIQYLLLRHKSRRLFLILSLQLWCRALPIYLLYYLCSCGAPRRRFFSYYLWSCGAYAAKFLIISSPELTTFLLFLSICLLPTVTKPPIPSQAPVATPPAGYVWRHWSTNISAPKHFYKKNAQPRTPEMFCPRGRGGRGPGVFY